MKKQPTRAEMEDYQVLHQFKVLHLGWEMDNEAWIAKNKKGRSVLLMTSHGGLYDYGQDISELHGKIRETRDVLAGLKKAVALINDDQ